MKTVKVEITGKSPLSFSKFYQVPELPKESKADYDERTWRERIHYDAKGEVFIPGMMFKNCLSAAAKYLSIQIPGKGKSTYTKHFEAGVMVIDPVMLGIKKDDVPCEHLHVPADGVRGGTKRVVKCFPRIDEWRGTATFLIMDETITREVFEQHLSQAGDFIGVGRFRPRNNGYYGRFSIKVLSWK